jgi:hypothetical protein
MLGCAALAVLFLSAAGCRTPKAMDALWSKDLVDDNVFPRNPAWHQMTKTGQPPDICTFCPCSNEDPEAWMTATNCASQALDNNSSAECFGHWNWFPVAYEGTVTWGGHSNSVTDDDDYYFEVARPSTRGSTSVRLPLAPTLPGPPIRPPPSAVKVRSPGSVADKGLANRKLQRRNGTKDRGRESRGMNFPPRADQLLRPGTASYACRRSAPLDVDTASSRR